MVGIKGIGGVPEPTPNRQSKVRNRHAEGAKTDKAADGVAISGEAREAARDAAEVSRLAQVAKTGEDMRADRVAAAKERIERGDYKRRDVVEQVAEKVSKYLP